MPIESERLQENILKTTKIESNLDYLSGRVEKLCIQIDNSLPLLEKINLRMEDDILRRTASDKLLTKLADDVNQLTFIQSIHEQKISLHETIINDLNKIAESQKTILKASKIGWKALVSLCIAAASIWGYIENKRDQRHHEAMISIQEIEEKKKRLDYNREKYLIRNGKWKDGE